MFITEMSVKFYLLNIGAELQLNFHLVNALYISKSCTNSSQIDQTDLNDQVSTLFIKFKQRMNE